MFFIPIAIFFKIHFIIHKQKQSFNYEEETLSETDDASRQVATTATPAAGQRSGERYNEQHMGGGGHLMPLPPFEY